MSPIEFWPGLPEAWRALRVAREGEVNELRPGERARRWKLIKSEPRVAIARMEVEGRTPLVCKIYRTPGHLGWRTLGVASRANREFSVMMESHRRGLPVVRPRYWLEHRHHGCVQFSALALDAVEGPDLESWLAGQSAESDSRLKLAMATGALLSLCHRKGLYWGTARPRNLLVESGEAHRILAIDLPYARLHQIDLRGTTRARTDLSCILMMSTGDLAFSDGERQRLMLGYCDGDEGRAKSLNAEIHPMTRAEWKRQRLLRRLNNVLFRTARSPGQSGDYCLETGEYRPSSSTAVRF